MLCNNCSKLEIFTEFIFKSSFATRQGAEGHATFWKVSHNTSPLHVAGYKNIEYRTLNNNGKYGHTI